LHRDGATQGFLDTGEGLGVDFGRCNALKCLGKRGAAMAKHRPRMEPLQAAVRSRRGGRARSPPAGSRAWLEGFLLE